MQSQSLQSTPGPALPGYRWVRALGSGGFADVHLYRQEVPARDVAIKILRASGNAGHSALLEREAHAMAAASGHPALLPLHSFDYMPDGRPYLVMEYCPVSNLGAQARTEPLTLVRALDIMVKICGGAEMLHRANYVHRDIKPANLMIDAYGRPMLSDFGVAAHIGEVTSGNADGFSLLWAPPEQQVPGCAAHPSADVWSLAATAWTLLAGRSPFEDPFGDNSVLATTARVHEGRLPQMGRADVPLELVEVLSAAMVTEPGARTASAAELGQGLQDVQAHIGLARTSMDLHDGVVSVGGQLSGAGSGPAEPQVDDDRTHVRAYALYNTSGEDLPSVEEKEEVVVETPKRRTHPVAILILVLCAVAATAGLVVAMLTHSGGVVFLGDKTFPGDEITDGPTPENPVAPPPPPAKALSGQVKDGRVYWTWQYDPADTQQSSAVGESARQFLYQVTVSGEQVLKGQTALNAFDYAAKSGENCLEIYVVGAGGRQSEEARECVTVP